MPADLAPRAEAARAEGELKATRRGRLASGKLRALLPRDGAFEDEHLKVVRDADKLRDALESCAAAGGGGAFAAEVVPRTPRLLVTFNL